MSAWVTPEAGGGVVGTDMLQRVTLCAYGEATPLRLGLSSRLTVLRISHFSG